MRNEMPINTKLEDIDIRDVDLAFIGQITSSDVFDFLSYLANDRAINPNSTAPDYGIEPSARARKLSAIKSFYKYLTVRTKQLAENPVAELEYPKLRKSLPKYLTMEQSAALLRSVAGQNEKRDYAILMLFLNCGIRRSELVGLDLSDVYEDRIRVIGKGNKERIVYFDARAKLHLQEYLDGRTDDNPALFVTLRAPHERIQIGGIEHRLREMGKRLNIPKVHPHKFRRTLATMAIDKGMPIEQLQRLLGHQRIDTTLQYAMVKQSNVKTAHRKYIG
jgi:site-specific recombinase XerD